MSSDTPPPRRRPRRKGRRPRPTTSWWKKAGDVAFIILKVATAAVGLYGALNGCSPV